MFVADGSQSIIIGTDGSSQSGGVLYNNYQATYISEADWVMVDRTEYDHI